MSKVACLVTCCGRPKVLSRSLPQIMKLDCPTLVVDDSRTPGDRLLIQDIVGLNKAQYMRLPENRGLATGLNIGLSYFLADSGIEWISYFQDDVDVNPRTIVILEKVHQYQPYQLLSGRDSHEHPTVSKGSLNGYDVLFKESMSGVHLHGHRDYWKGVMPIPTNVIGSPKPLPGQPRGVGSNVDWWITKDAPNAAYQKRVPIVVVPGLVRTFLFKAQDSSWNNDHKGGEDPPLKGGM